MPSMHIIPWSIFSLKTKINIIAKKKMSSGQGTGHYHQVWSKSDVGKYVKKTCCQKEEEAAAETSRIQKPAAAPAG